MVGASASTSASAQTIRPVEQPITIHLVPGYAVECTQTQEVLTADNQKQKSASRIKLHSTQTDRLPAIVLESNTPQVQTKQGRTAGPFNLGLRLHLNEFGDFEDVEIVEFQVVGMSQDEIRVERADFEKTVTKVARQLIGGNFSYLGKPLRSGDTFGSEAQFKSAIEDLYGTKTSGVRYELRVLGESTAPTGEPILVFEQNGEGHLLQNGNWVFFKFSGNYSLFQRSGLMFQESQSFDASISSSRSSKVLQTTNCQQVSEPIEKRETTSPSETKPTSDLTSRLEAVKRLLDQGLITETEAANKRREILEGL